MNQSPTLILGQPKMSQIHFSFHYYHSTDAIKIITSRILNIFLEPNSVASVDAIAEEFLELLANNENQEYNARLLVREIILKARDVPYHHASQMKMVDLLDRLLSSTYSHKVFT